MWNSLKARAGRHVDLLACLLLTALAFVFMGAALFPAEGRMLYGFDVERLFYPFGEFMFAAFRDGRLVYQSPSLDQIRRRAGEQLACLPASVLPLSDASTYPVVIDRGLGAIQRELIEQRRDD